MAAAEAYFVGRSELLSWINSTLGLRINKVEETANGAVACQLMDALFPGVVPMKKVDFNAKNDYDMINNYKVLQDVFNKLGVEKHCEVAKLIKGRPLDNTEFMQWFKAYWDTTTGGQPIADYDPAARRQLCKTGALRGSGSGPAAAAPTRSAMGGTAASTAGSLQRRISQPVSYATKGALPAAGAAATPTGAGTAARTGGKKKLISSSARTSVTSDSDTIERLQEEVSSWRVSAETATKEKDFYYSKLRAIELLCNTGGVVGSPVAKAVEDILYAATQEEGEACLAAAIAELEAAGGAAPADDAQQPEGIEQLQQQLQGGLDLQQHEEALQGGLQVAHGEEQGYAAQGVGQQVGAAAAMPVC
ncbi:calponin homology domain-containing protein [Scenedesmus sp. NREL 46B-D3]|nr:calponin homology domain-containing protein [Scenedesmus sp. NREL 46B-D3]